MKRFYLGDSGSPTLSYVLILIRIFGLFLLLVATFSFGKNIELQKESSVAFKAKGPVLLSYKTAKRELVIVDSSLTQMTAELKQERPESIFIELQKSDTSESLSKKIEVHKDIDSIHIFSHGAPGVLYLADDIITSQNIASNKLFKNLKQSTKPGSDLILYACNLAHGELGKVFLDRIHNSLSLDIAASKDLTGDPSLGGNWELEYQVGNIAARPLIHAKNESKFKGVVLLQSTFAGLSSVDSGGSGYKKVTDTNIVVSNDFINAGSEIYFNDNSSSSKTLVIKTDGVNTATFDVNALTFYSFVGTGVDLGSSSTVVFKDTSGSVLRTMTLNADKELTSTNTDIFSFFDNNKTSPVSGVANIEFNITLSNCCNNGNNFSSLTFKNITYTNPVAPSSGPTITNVTYDSSNGSLVVTGTDFEVKTGAANDISVSKLTFTGNGGSTYTLTTSDVELTSATQFTVVLNSTDRLFVDALLNKNGTSSDDSTTYNLAAADDFVANITTGDTAIATNGITVSNYSNPTVSSANYNGATGSLVVTGTGFSSKSGGSNDVDVTKLSIAGESGGSRTLTTSNVEVTSATQFTVILNAADQNAVASLLNKDGTSSVLGTTYNLSAADNWMSGGATSVDISDTSSNTITASNVTTAATTTATSFSTLDGSNLDTALVFDGDAETLTIGAASHTSGTANGQGGTDTFVTVDTLDMSNISVSNFEAITIPASSSVTMTSTQHGLFSTFSDNASQSITLTSGSDDITGSSAIESYTLGSSYSGTFTLGAASQNVAGADSAVDTVSVGTLTVTGDITGGSGADVLQMSTGSNIAGANTLNGFETVEITGSVTMTEAQHDAFTTAITASGGSDQITISAATDGLTADPDVETYVLGAANSISLDTAAGNLAQSVTGSSGNDTITLGGGTYTGTLNGVGGTGDTLSLTDSTSVSGATVSNLENLTIANDASVTLSAAQFSQFSGTITANGTEQITVSGDGNFTTLSTTAIETYSVSDSSTNSRAITLGSGHTSGTISATSSTDVVTFNIGTQDFGGALIGQGTNDIVQMGTGSSIASATLTNVSKLTIDSGASVTMTEAQHDAFTSGFTAAGTETITISAATDGFTGDANVENYTLGVANTITLTSGQSTGTITGSTGNDTIDIGTLSLGAGTLNPGDGTDTLVMGNGSSIAASNTSNFENLTLDSGANGHVVTMTVTQLADFIGGTITAANTEQITISGDGNFSTLNNAAIEIYLANDDSSNTRTITLGTNDTGTNISATSNDDAVDFVIPGITYTGTITGDTTTRNDKLSLANNANISGATINNVTALALNDGAEITMTASQHAGMTNGITGNGLGNSGETINITGDGDIVINTSNIENYNFSDDSRNTRKVTTNSNVSTAFNFNSNSDAVTVTLNGVGFEGTLTGNASTSNTLEVSGSSRIANGTITNFANLTLQSDVFFTATPSQINGFNGTITANAGNDNINFSETGSLTGGNLSAIETLTTGSGGNITITLPASDANGKTLTVTTSASDSFTVTGSTGSQTINGSAGGDSLSGGDGADTLSPGAGADSMTGGNGNDIFSGSSSDLNGDTIADLSEGDTVKITGVTGLTTSNVRFNGSNTLQADTDATDFSAVEVAITLSDGAGGSLNILAVNDNGSDTDITFEETNNAPVFASLNGTPAFTEGGSAQVIDSDVTVSDTELDALNSSSGNYSGATLTISRNGGASSDDVFAESGSLSALTASGNLTYNSLAYGTVTTNSGGTLVLTFSDTSNVPTTAIVASIMQSITYSNGSDAPDSSVVLDWTFNDGTTNSTGTNQATVSITAENDAPVLSAAASPTLTAINEDVESGSNTGTDVATMVTDGSITDPDGSAVEAIAVITVDNTNGAWQYSTDNGSNWNNFSGTTGSSVDLSSASRLLDGTLSGASTHKIRFVPNANYNGTATITYRAWDKTSGSAGATADTSTNGNTTAFSTVSDSASITINSVNDAPSVDTNTGVTVERGSNITISNSALSTSDVEDSASNVTYTVTAIPTVGAMQLSSSNLSVNDTFTQDDIDNSRVRYVHAGAVNTSDSFSFSVADTNSGSVTGQTFNITIQDTTAPTISNVSIANQTHKVDDSVTVTITVNSDSDTYSLGSSTVAGYTLSSLSKTNDTTYTASFTVSDGGTDLAAGSSVPVSVVLTDSSSNSNTAFTTAISQSGDAIYANLPDVTLAADTTTIAEDGGVSTLTASITGTLNNQWPDNVTVTLSYSGTATNATDYNRSGTSVTISSGSSSNTATVTAVADTIYDATSNETVIVDVSAVSVGNESGVQQQTITITDAESAPSVTLSIDNSSIPEAGTTSSTPTVTLSNATFQDVTVALGYSGTATAGTDYNNDATTSITISQATTSQSGTPVVTATQDTVAEGDETVIIDVTNVSGGGATEATEQQVTVTIADDDNTAPSFSNLDGTPTYTEAGSAVTLDSDVVVADSENDAKNSSQGNYTSSTLTIARNGGANSEDTFAVASGSQMVVSGSDITNSIGDKFASYTSSSGTLTVTFSGDLTTPTTALVNEVLQNITYSNSSDEPPTSVTLDWSFSDSLLSTSGTNQTVVTITPVNDAPVIGTNTGISVSEGGTEVLNNTELNENDPDDSGTGLTYTVTTSPSHGALQLSSLDLATNGTGSFTQDDIDNNRVRYVHAGGEATSDSFVVSLADGGEDSVSAATATVNITVTGLNDAPAIATNQTLTVNQGSTGIITNSFLNEDDPDDSGSGLTYTLTSVPTNGVLSVSGSVMSLSGTNTFTQDDIDNSNVVYTHAGGDNTSDSFNFSLADGGENSASAVSGTFNFSINDNIAPTLSSSSPSDNATSIAVSDNIVLTFSENIQLGSSGNIVIVNAATGTTVETFDVSTGSGSNAGTVSASGTDVTINPGSDLNAGRSFAVQVDSSAVTDDSSNTNGFAGIADSTTLNFTTQPKVVISASPTSILEPAKETTTFTLTLQDEDGTSFSATESVTVNVSLGGTATVGSDYTATDCSTGNCNISISSGQSSATFTAVAIDDGTGDAGETIIASIDSITTSNATEDVTQTATVTIGENTAPTVSNLPTALTVTEDEATNVDLSATSFADGQGDSLTVTLAVSSGTISSPLGASGNVTVSNSETSSMSLAGSVANLNAFLDNSNAVAITTDTNGNSDITLTVTPNDGSVDGTAATSTVSVTAVNDNPSFAIAGGTFDMSGGSGFSTTTYTETENSVTMTVVNDSGVWTSSDLNNSFSTTGDTISVSTQNTNSTTVSFDSAIDIESLVFLNNYDSLGGTFTLSVTTGSGSDLTVTKSSFTDGSSNVLSPSDWRSVEAFTITHSSGNFSPILDTLVFTKSAPDMTFSEDVAGNVDLSAYMLADVDSSSITLTLSISAGALSAPADGGSSVAATLVSSSQITLVGSPSAVSSYLDTAAAIQYTGVENANGDNVATLTMVINDGDGSGNLTAQTINLDITAVNDAPVISGTPVSSVNEDTTYSFTPVASDVDGDTLTYSVSNSPSWASFSTTTGTLSGTPGNSDVSTTSNIVITVSDGTVSADLDAFSIEVINVNDAPTFDSGFAIGLDEDASAGSITITASDVDNTSLTFSISSQGSKGSASIRGSGKTATLTYVPDANENGSDTVGISVSDGLETVTTSVGITINPTNDAPTIAGTPSTLVEVGSEYSFTPSADDIDGDTLTFSIENKPDWASFDSRTGTLSGSPVANDNGTTEGIVITVSDGELSDSLAAFGIEVIDPNQNFAPTAEDLVSATDEDTGVEVELQGTDVNEDTLTYAIATQPSNGTVVIAGNIATYTPTANFNGTGSFTYIASDSLLESEPATVTITVAPINDAPVIEGEPLTQTAIDTQYSFTPDASDVDSTELTFSIENQPTWAAFDTTTGELSGTPVVENVGTFADIVISVSDGELSSSLAGFSIEVIDPNANTAPVATDIDTETAEDTPVTITLTATDDDGDALTYSVITEPQFGTFELEGNQLTFTPQLNLFDETEVLEFTATDGVAESNTATLSILITPVNDAPVIEGEPQVTVRVGQEYSFIPTASDIEGDTLTFTIANQPRWSTFDGSTGELSGIPSSADVGTYGDVTISVSDGEETVSLAAFNIDVLANEAPVITGNSVTAVEVGTSYQFTPTASDSDGDTLTFSVENQPGWTEFDSVTGTLSGTPVTDGIGDYTGIIISVSDGIDSASLPAFDIEVCEVCGNVAPTITGVPAASVTEGDFYSFEPIAEDSNNDVLSFEIVNQPGWTAFDTQTGALTGTPGETDIGDFVGIVISVSDGEFSASLPAFSITVEELNEAPTISGEPASSVFRDVEYVFTPTASDPDGDVLTFSIENAPSWAAFNVRTGTLRGTPDATEVGNYNNIVISVTDGVNTTSLTSFAIEVLASNSVPEISGSPRTGITQGEAYSFTPTASDADGDVLSFSVEGMPAWLSLNSETGTLSGTPAGGDVGTTDDIILTVSDGQDSASLDAFAIEVTSSNTTPIASDSSVNVSEDSEVTIVASVTDSDGDALTLTLVSNASNGDLSATETGWVYTPNNNFTGNDLFVYQASDGDIVSNNATISITVDAVNDLPVADDDTFTVDQNGNGIYTLDVLSNDDDVDIDTSGDILTIQGADANFGTVNIVNNQLEFNPGASFIGNVTLVYAIRDTAGASAQAEVDLTINGVAGVGAPIVTVPQDISVDATGLFTNVDLGVASAVDADGNPLPVSLVSGSTSFAPGAHTVFWQAEDSFGTVTTESQTVNVNPLISLSKDQVVAEGSQVTVEVILNGDAPSYPLTVSYEITGSATGDGIDHDAASGSVTFAEGREQLVVFETFVDSDIEVDETIQFALNSGQNVGANNSSVITISEANIAPEISLTVNQNTEERLTVAQDEGQVTISGSVSDVNPQDTLFVEWSSDGLSNSSDSDNSFVFNPADVATGVYQVTLFASDDGEPILSNTSDVFIEVVDTLEVLSDTVDSDGDLIPDSQEGYADGDGDGIPDYLDSINDCNVVPEQALNQEGFLVESEPGVCMRQGSTSAVNESDGIEVIPDVGDGRRKGLNAEGKEVIFTAANVVEDEEAANIGGIFDFILYNLPEEGQSARVVIPQRNPVPANAVYRKYKANTQTWVDFVTNDNNSVQSSPGLSGVCPPPGSDEWQPGLNEGDWCVQLTIQDGGPNDDDGLANGAIVDPGGVAVILDNNTLPEAANDTAQMQWNTSIDIDVLGNDTDVDGDALTIVNVAANFGDVEIIDETLIRYTPDVGFVGEDEIVYAISDGNNGTGSARVFVTINGNRAPGAVDDAAATDDETAIEIDVLANDIDVDGDTLTLESATAESGSVSITESNTLLYTPQDGFNGIDTITYVVSDIFGETASATVSVTVDGNDAPVANNDNVTTAFNTSITIDVLSNDLDADGDALSVTSATVSSGSVVINDNNTLTYTPVSGFSGTVQITYQITDGLLTAEAVATVTVQPEPIETIIVNNSSSGGGSLFWLIITAMGALLVRRPQRLQKIVNRRSA